MRSLFLSLAAFLLFLPSGVRAQVAGKVRITDIHIGLPAATEPDEPPDEKGRTYLFKSGAWTPIAIEIDAGPSGTDGPGKITVATNDSDEMQNRYHSEFPRLQPGQHYTAFTYTRPGSLQTSLDISVDVDHGRVQNHAVGDALELGDTLFLTLGSPLPGLRAVLSKHDTHEAESAKPTPYRAAFVASVDALPTRWYGYDAVDRIILTSGDATFVRALLQDRAGRKEALAEWVRRGGQLTVSAGENQSLVAELLNACFPEPLPLGLRIVGGQRVSRVQDVERINPSKRLPPFVQAATASGQLPLISTASLGTRPEAPVEVILPRQGRDIARSVVARSPYGLGQVVVVAFDLDRPPFTTWGGQPDFWRRLLTIHRAGTSPADSGAPNGTEAPEDLATQLQNRLEQFHDVPVISFGWVAVCIFLYILIVGPLDYFLLKKFVGRLEFTWISCPVIVLSVSGIVYLVTNNLKAHDLRVNKVDVVDMDLQSGQAYGQTWFTVFSPRIDHYTVGVKPGFNASSHSVQSQELSVLTTWLGRPDASYGGYGRARSQGLFRRAYDYDSEATGLKDVPIQVWATKSFNARWRGRWDPRQQPVTADLHHDGPERLSGTVTNRLPIAMDDVALIWGGHATGSGSVFRVGHLEPNETRTVSLRAGENTQRLTDWAGGFMTANDSVDTADTLLPGINSLMRRILFLGEASRREGIPDEALYQLDQSWRTHLPGQVTMFGRVRARLLPTQTQDKSDVTSTLFLHASGGESAPGSLVQDTYLRFYIPVRSDAKK